MSAQPFARTQVPAWYRFRVGGFECTVASDGNIDTSDAGPIFPQVDPDQVERVSRELCAPNHSSYWLAQNVLVVNTGEHLVLIDCGMGKEDPSFQPHAGKLLTNLDAAGIDPAAVDFVLLTHLHADHCGGLMAADGDRAFPNATLVLDKADLPPTGASDTRSLETAMERVEHLARMSVQPYLADFVATADLRDVLSGITAVATPGHTPGHTSYLVESDGDSLMVIGDLFHDYVIEPMHPEWENTYDGDPAGALDTRLKAFRQFTEKRQKVLVYHFPWPGLGWFRQDGTGFRFMPDPMNLLPESLNLEGYS